MAVTYANHTPAHITALFDAVIAQLPPLDASIVLCTSLPETVDEGAHYILLGHDGAPAPLARVSSIANPLPLPQLVARISALATAPTAYVTLAGGWQFSPSARMLEHADHPPVALTELEAALLSHLAHAAGSDIARETLMRDIWRYDEATQTHTLETHMYRLRGKLEKLQPSACQIATTDAGYRLAIS